MRRYHFIFRMVISIKLDLYTESGTGASSSSRSLHLISSYMKAVVHSPGKLKYSTYYIFVNVSSNGSILLIAVSMQRLCCSGVIHGLSYRLWSAEVNVLLKFLGKFVTVYAYSDFTVLFTQNASPVHLGFLHHPEEGFWLELLERGDLGAEFEVE